MFSPIISPSMTDALMALRPTDESMERVLDDTAAERLNHVRTALENIAGALTDFAKRNSDLATVDGFRVSLNDFDAESLELIDQILGEGEVSGIITDGMGNEVLRLQEAVVPGLWRIQDGENHYLEVADMPGIVRFTAAEAPPALNLEGILPASEAEDMQQGLMNARPVLAEIADHIKQADQCRQHKKPLGRHELTLTLLPLTPDDVALLGTAMGNGRVVLVSRGYGNCRVSSTSLRHVWQLEYFNSEDQLILHTVEIGDVPAAALADREDMTESATRLLSIVETYFPCRS